MMNTIDNSSELVNQQESAEGKNLNDQVKEDSPPDLDEIEE